MCPRFELNEKNQQPEEKTSKKKKNTEAGFFQSLKEHSNSEEKIPKKARNREKTNPDTRIESQKL